MLLDAAASISKVPEVVFKRCKSVRKEDKEEIINAMDMMRACISIIESRSLELLTPKAVTISAGVQTEPEETPDLTGRPDIDAITACVRKELQEFREELGLNDASRNAQPHSYAAAASARPAFKHPVKTPVSRPALVLESSSSATHTHKDALDAWRKNVSSETPGSLQQKSNTVSNGKVRVEFDTVQQRDSALRKIREVPSLKAEESKRRRPQVILKGVSKETVFDDGIALLFDQNTTLKDAGSPSDALIRFKPA